MARVLCRYTSPTWRVRSATVQPGQVGTTALGSADTTAHRRAKSAARQSRNREYSMPDSSAHAPGPLSPAATWHRIPGSGPPDCRAMHMADLTPNGGYLRLDRGAAPATERDPI